MTEESNQLANKNLTVKVPKTVNNEKSSNIDNLIARLRNGDPDAAYQFVADYGKHIHREARRRMADERLQAFFDQSDIFQSVMLNFLVRVELGDFEFNDAKELLGLLTSMTRNKVTDRYRKACAARRDYRKEVRGDSKVLNLTSKGHETPSQVISREEVTKLIEEKTPADIKQIAEMRNDGLAWDEIALKLSLTADAARKKYSRFLKNLKLEVEDE